MEENQIPTREDVTNLMENLWSSVEIQSGFKIKLFDILILTLSIFLMTFSVILVLISKEMLNLGPKGKEVIHSLDVALDILNGVLIISSFAIIFYEMRALWTKYKTFRKNYVSTSDPEKHGAVINKMINKSKVQEDINKSNQFLLDLKLYKKLKYSEKNILVIGILNFYNMQVNDWNLVYVEETIRALRKKYLRQYFRLWGILIIVNLIVLFSLFILWNV